MASGGCDLFGGAAGAVTRICMAGGDGSVVCADAGCEGSGGNCTV